MLPNVALERHVATSEGCWSPHPSIAQFCQSVALVFQETCPSSHERCQKLHLSPGAGLHVLCHGAIVARKINLNQQERQGVINWWNLLLLLWGVGFCCNV